MVNINLFSNRIKTICNMLIKTTTVADIGCDHGYSSIYIIQSKKADKVIACDVNKLPLAKAENNFYTVGLNNKIETRISDGFSNITINEIDSAVISGMGGMLIINILNRAADLVSSLSQLVIQPQHDLYNVRKYVHSIDFMIEDEQMLYEDNIFYNILSVVKGSEIYTEKEYLLGKILIDRQDVVLKQYLKQKLIEQKVIIDRLIDVNTSNSIKRLSEIKYINQIYEEVTTAIKYRNKT